MLLWRRRLLLRKARKVRPPVKYFSNGLVLIKKLKTVAKNRNTVPTKMTFLKTEDLKPLFNQTPKAR